MSIRKGIFSLIVSLLVVGLAACSGPNKAPRSVGPAPAPLVEHSFSGRGFSPEGPAGVEGQTPPAYKDLSNPSQPLVLPARKQVVTGSLSLQVANVSTALSEISSLASSFQGYVSRTEIQSALGSIVLRVPAEKFDALVKALSGRGSVLSFSTEATDVTDQWVDVDSRLASKRILQERYLTYLRQAKNVSDLMTIERSVNDLTSEIERLEGSFKLLENQVAYSTLTIELSQPGRADRQGYNLQLALSDLLGNVSDFFQILLVVVIYGVVIGVPLVVLVALLWWVAFGRIGLVRRLFRLLSRKGKSPS